MKNRRNNRGFTLIELIIYFAILGVILVAVVEVSLIARESRSRFLARSVVSANANRVLNTVDFLVRNSSGFVDDASSRDCFSTSKLLLYMNTSTANWDPPSCMGAYTSGAIGIEAYSFSGATTTDAANYAYDIATDGTYVYIAGSTDANDGYVEKRYAADGLLDTTFDSDGKVTITDANALAAIAIDSTYMYILGSDNLGDWYIEKRLLTTGALDTGFGTNGVVTQAFANIPTDIAVDGTAMYILGVNEASPTGLHIEKRLLTDGTLDATFDDDGIVDVAGKTYGNALAMDSTYLYAVGTKRRVSGFPVWDQEYLEQRLLSSGALVASYLGDTTLTGYGNGIVVDSTSVYTSGINDDGVWRIEKHSLSDLSLDTSFGTSGAIVSSDGLYIGNDGLATDGTSLFITGTDATSVLRIEKRSMATGSLVASFGNSGVATSAAGSIYLTTGAVFRQPYLYTAGQDNSILNLYFERRDAGTGVLAGRSGVRLICYQNYPNPGKAATCESPPASSGLTRQDLTDPFRTFVGVNDLVFATTTVGSRQAIETILSIGPRDRTGINFSAPTITPSTTTSFRIAP